MENIKRWVIRNDKTGAYIHTTIDRILEFATREEAENYARRIGLDLNIYSFQQTFQRYAQ